MPEVNKVSPSHEQNLLAYYLMAPALYQQQLKGLCSTQQTFARAKSILNLSSLRTGHGTGFAGNTPTLHAVAAYLASEQCVSSACKPDYLSLIPL